MNSNLISLKIFVLLLGAIDWRVSALIGHKDDQVNNYFRRTDGIVSGDGGWSVALSNKRTLWFFGDSHYNDFDKKDGNQNCIFNVRNSAMVQPINDWTQNHTTTLVGAPTPFKSLFKADDDKKQFYWTGHGIQIGDTVYVYCSELENSGTGGNLGFRGTDNDHWCKMDAKTLKVTGYTKLQHFNGIGFGQGFVDEGDYIYGYGTKGNGKPLGTSIYLSRFHKSKPEQHDFEFWDGSKWVKDVKAAKPVVEEFGGGHAMHKVNGKYVIISTEFSIKCDQGHLIYVQHSDHITGPFTAKKAIHSIDEAKEQGHYPFFYMAIAHPELINEKNELLITYSINEYGGCLKGCPNGRMNPDHYRLRGVRVNVNDLFKL